jgi:hypothetical protein
MPQLPRQYRALGWAWPAGDTDRRAGFKVQFYEALRPLTCGACGRTIPVGAHVTRHRQHGPGPTVAPFCRACRPFTEMDG